MTWWLSIPVRSTKLSCFSMTVQSSPHKQPLAPRSTSVLHRLSEVLVGPNTDISHALIRYTCLGFGWWPLSAEGSAWCGWPSTLLSCSLIASNGWLGWEGTNPNRLTENPADADQCWSNSLPLPCPGWSHLREIVPHWSWIHLRYQWIPCLP